MLTFIYLLTFKNKTFNHGWWECHNLVTPQYCVLMVALDEHLEHHQTYKVSSRGRYEQVSQSSLLSFQEPSRHFPPHTCEPKDSSPGDKERLYNFTAVHLIFVMTSSLDPRGEHMIICRVPQWVTVHWLQLLTYRCFSALVCAFCFHHSMVDH